MVLGNEWPWSGGFAQLVKWAELIRANGGALPAPAARRGAQGFDQCGFPLAPEAAGNGTFAAMKAAADATKDVLLEASAAAAAPAAAAAAAPFPPGSRSNANNISTSSGGRRRGLAQLRQVPAAGVSSSSNTTLKNPPGSGPSLGNAFWRHRGLQKGGIPYPGPGQHSWSQWQDYAGADRMIFLS